VLMKINCYDWASLMCVMLQARGLWIAMSEGTSDYTEDRMALEVLSKAMPVGMMSSIESKASTKAVWESITLRNVGVDRVRMAKARSIKHEFDSLMFNNEESVDDFGTCIGQIMNELAVLGFEYKAEEIMWQFVEALPPKFQ
jgi:hypothetical protein